MGRERTRRGRGAMGGALACLMAAAWLTPAGCRRTTRQPRRRQVVLYCSVDQAVAEPIVAAFEKHSGIEVLARYDTEASKTVGLVQRLRAEAASPAADVFWSNEVFYTIRLAGEGLLAPYRGAAVADWPRTFTDAQGRWHGLALRARVIGYHTGRIRADEAPKRLEDLLEPKWKGRLAMATPEFGTTGGDVASWFVHYGDRRAEEILRGLKANGVRLVDGNSTAVRAVATGQADLCLTDTDDVHAARRNGWPVAMNPLQQGDDGVLTIPNTVARVKGGPHSAEAETLIAFILGGPVEEMLARSDSHNAPVRASVAERFPAYRIAKPLAIDYGQVAEKLPVAIRKAGEVLR